MTNLLPLAKVIMKYVPNSYVLAAVGVLALAAQVVLLVGALRREGLHRNAAVGAKAATVERSIGRSPEILLPIAALLAVPVLGVISVSAARSMLHQAVASTDPVAGIKLLIHGLGGQLNAFPVTIMLAVPSSIVGLLALGFTLRGEPLDITAISSEPVSAQDGPRRSAGIQARRSRLLPQLAQHADAVAARSLRGFREARRRDLVSPPRW